MLINSSGKESTGVKILRLVFAPLLTAFLAFGGSYLAMQQKVSSIDSSVKEIVMDLKDVKTQQSAIFKDYYLPRREEWQTHSQQLNKIQAEHEFMQKQLNDVYSDIRKFHVTGGTK